MADVAEVVFVCELVGPQFKFAWVMESANIIFLMADVAEVVFVCGLVSLGYGISRYHIPLADVAEVGLVFVSGLVSLGYGINFPVADD